MPDKVFVELLWRLRAGGAGEATTKHTAEYCRTRPNGKRISLQNVIVLFDLKTKSTRPLPAFHGRRRTTTAQCASKRDTECTCGASCADVNSAIYFSILRFIRPE